MTSEPEPDNAQRVEAYLDQLLVPLGRNLSAFHREELRRELRAHLWGRIDAYRELGQSENDAVTEALQQFGGAKDFARQWRREWTKTAAVSASTLRIWEAGKAALKPTLGGIAAAFLPLVAIQEFPYGRYGTLAQLVTTPVGTILFWGLIAFAFLILPLLVGARQGRRRPNAGTGVAAVLTAGIAAASLLYLAVDNPDTEKLCSLLLALIIIWTPTACASAALSGDIERWWTQRRKRVIA